MKKEQLDTIFEAARQLEDRAQRDQYLKKACGADDEARQWLDSMLGAHEEAEAYFKDDGFWEPTRDDTTSISLPDPISEGPGTVIGRYKLLQKIAEGGMGVVFMAEQQEPIRRKVAFKVIKVGMDTKSVIARFEAERQALALMDHPSIAKVLDAGATEAGRPFFVMELVKGVPINVYCDKARLGMEARLKLFVQVCHAIQHAHQKGVIHRDIKPSNVLVTLNSGNPHPIVIDFGVAKATNQRLTEKTLFTNFAQMIGTPAYMSPEQAEMSQLDVDTRSDIYSLGVLLYELLTGSTPFPEKELLSQGYGEMQRILAEQEPERPSLRLSTLEGDQLEVVATSRRDQVPAMAKQIRGDLDWIVLKALDKDRSRRYGTASGLADDIQRHLNAEPVLAAKPTVIYQLTKVYRRHKPAFAAAAGIFLALLVGLVASLNQASRAQQALDEAVHAKAVAEQATRSEEALRLEAERQSELARELAEEQRLSAYLGDVRAANDAVVNNEFNRARELLLAQKPGPSQEDYRGIEWRYLWHATRDRAIARTKLEMQPTIKSSKLMELSPDRRFLAIQDSSASVRILDYSSLNEVCQIPFDEEYYSISMRFSPDNSRFYVRFRIRLAERTQSSPVSWRKGVHIYDASTWSLITTVDPSPTIGFPLNEKTWVMYNMHAGPAYDPRIEDRDFVAFNPHDDGRFAVRPVLQNVSGRTEVHTLPAPAGTGRLAIRARDVDRDESEGYLWQIWDTSEREDGTLVGEFTSNGFPEFDSSGRFYFTSEYIGKDVSSVKLFGFEEESEIKLTPRAMTLESDYKDVSFSDDSRWLVAMGSSGRIHVWSTESGDYAGFIWGQVGRSWQMVVGGGTIACLNYDGSLVASPLEATSLQPTDWTKIPTVADGYDKTKWKSQLPGPELLDGVHPRLLELFKTGMLPPNLPMGLGTFLSEINHEVVLSRCRMSPNCRYFSVASLPVEAINDASWEDYDVGVSETYFDLANGDSMIAEWGFTILPVLVGNQVADWGHPDFIDGYRLIRQGESGFELWDLREQTRTDIDIDLEMGVLRNRSLPFNYPLIIARGDRLIIGEKRGDVGSGLSFFDLESEQLKPTSIEFGRGLSILKDSPSGGHVLLGGEPQAFQIYDVETESLVSNLGHGRSNPDGWFSTDERTVLIRSAGQYSFWHVNGGRKLVRLQGVPVRDGDPLISREEVTFSPDQNQIFLRRDIVKRTGTDSTSRTDLYVLDIPTLAEIDEEIGEHFP